MVVDFSKLDLREQPVLILKNTAGVPMGTLGSAMNVTADIKYNEASVLEFNIPAWVDGEPTPFYDSVIGMRVVELYGIGQFILMNPKETGDGVKKIKACKGYSIEYEFTFKNITLANSTYNFWNPVTPESTLMQIILDMMPSWSIGSIDSELIGKYRTFEVSDENLYNFIKGTIQSSYNCIFDFDTMERRINVRSAASAVPTNPVYISNQNLAGEITVEENTETIVTRIDVNGADGVNIRDVNPTGTNQIINLDYFMNTDNFPQSLIDKYYDWKETYKNYQQQYYNLSVEYALQVMRKATEQAALVELENELVSLENEQAVIIQAIAGSLETQNALDAKNTEIAIKQSEIEAKRGDLENISTDADNVYSQLVAINAETKFETFFTEEEYIQLDRYIKDGAISESSFVIQETDSYTNDDMGSSISGVEVTINGATISKVVNTQGKDIYSIKGGRIVSAFVDAEIISAAFEKASDDSFVMTAYLGSGIANETQFPRGCLSITGEVESISHNLTANSDMPDVLDGSELAVNIVTGYLYFTRNASEYEKRAVAWELFEYANETLEKMSQPSYTFGVTSSNFLSIDEFEGFKNGLRHGEKIYVGLSEDKTLSPICVGLKFGFDSPQGLSLEFSDTYTSRDSSFLLADLLEQSVSMGRNVDLSKYSYSAFMDSGAATKVKDFMTTALDVSKNAIMSSRAQAISWGDSGIRLRKWATEDHDAYDPKQVWLNNNSILMTDNNWATAELAIGNFHDKNLGDCWGVVAPNIVGTLLAGSNLVIESAKQDGGVAVFKVDAEGCVLHNSTLSVTSEDTDTHVLLDPKHGIMIGKYPLTDANGTIDDTKKLFYADSDGNLTLKGTVYATNGEFTGKINALEGYIGQPSQGWNIGNSSIWNGKPTYSSTLQGAYIGVDGISLGNSVSYIRARDNGFFTANNVSISGTITANSGEIGGCEIVDGVLKVGNANITSINASKITTGTMSANRIKGGEIDATDVTIKNLSADNITAGTLNCSNIKITNLSADSISAGTISAERIDTIPSSKVTGDFDSSRITGSAFRPTLIPNLDCSKIATGVLSGERIPSISADKIEGGTISGCSIAIGGDTYDTARFGVSPSGVVHFRLASDTSAIKVYGNGHRGRETYSCTTFHMAVVRSVLWGVVATVVDYVTLYFVGGFCVGWREGAY